MTGSDFSGRTHAKALRASRGERKTARRGWPVLSRLLMPASLAAALLLPAAAQTQAPRPVAPRGVQTFQFALANGMQVLVIPDSRAPVATQMLWFKVGGVDDPPGISGMAHFFEHMMFRGTRKVPGEGFTQAIARNGGESNAFTYFDYTAYYEQIARDRLPLAMQLEADRLANLDLSDANIATEREVVMEERRLRVENDPQRVMGEQMNAALHLSHPYGRPVVGWMEELRHIDRASATDFYRRHYAPNNAILVVAGNVTAEEVRVMAQREYGALPARPLAARAESAHPPRLAETRLRITREDAKVPILSRAYRVPSYATARPGTAEALETLAQALGGDQTSLLHRVLVEERKLATEAGASYDGYRRDMGEFNVYAVPRPGVSLENLERAMDQVLAQAAKAPPRGPDLDRAKTQLIAAVTFRRDSQYQMASAYGQALVIGLTVDDVEDWPRRIRAVSGNAVRDAARRLNRREAVTGYLIPAGGP